MTQYSINRRDRNQLERLWQQPETKRNISATNQSVGVVRQIFAALATFLAGSQQIRIWTKSTRQGVVWFAYDPLRDQRIGHCSEDELRAWLEARHHQ